MLGDALDITTGPVAIRYPRTPAPSVSEAEVGHGRNGRRTRAGSDACILAVGKMLDAAHEAADLLADEGVDCTVWDVRCVSPLDPAMLADAATHPLVVTVEDGVREGGAGTAIRDRLVEGTDPAPMVRVLGVPIEYIPHGDPGDILASLGLDGHGIAATVRAAR